MAGQIEDLERQKSKVNAIKDQASKLLNQYEDQLNPRVYEIAQENIEKADLGEENEKNNEEVKEKNVEEEQKTVARKKVVKKVPEGTSAVKKNQTAIDAAKRAALAKARAKKTAAESASATAVARKKVVKPTDED